jgi:5'-methylthioadenosine/S-adenosylhomocysteine nucleosidase
MILLLCAMKEEVSALLDEISVEKSENYFGMTYSTGYLLGKAVTVGLTGVGKVMSSMLTQKLIDVYKPDKIIFSGIAGAVNNSLGIGDIVISKDCIQHDMDAVSLGFERGEIPYTGIRIIRADDKLAAAAMTFSSTDSRVISGRILTGDQFIATGDKLKRNILSEELGGDAVEMEGAAVGFAAYMNKIPFLLIRIISDMADGNAPDNFRSFLKSSSQKLCSIVCHILARLD